MLRPRLRDTAVVGLVIRSPSFIVTDLRPVRFRLVAGLGSRGVGSADFNMERVGNFGRDVGGILGTTKREGLGCDWSSS